MEVNKPPKQPQKLLTWFCKDQWVDELLGDLEEEFKDNVKANGRRKAVAVYYKQVLLLLRPHILRKKENTPSMFKNYIKSAYRSLLKNKVYSAINISGLTVGVACCLLISLYVHDEMSYDKFFNASDRIYRVALERIYPTNTRFFGSSPVNMAPTLLENYPEVEEAGRLHRLFFQNEITVDIGEKTFIEDRYLFADNNFFNVFSFNFLEGNPSTALDAFNKVVLTRSTAKRFFGEESALNKVYQIDTSRYIVSGIIEDVPTNSHMSFDILGSIEALPFLQQAAETNSWINPWLFTYIKLREGVSEESFEEKLPEMVQSHGMASILSLLNISAEDYPESGNDFKYFLQPVEDIHLKSNLSVEVQANSDITYVYLLIAVVGFILIISCINFINLATARSAERAKEVGVRKVLGSRRALLVKQFLTESNLISIIALLLSIGLTALVLSKFNALVGKELSLWVLTDPLVILGLLAGSLLIGSLAGLYPAVVISSINSSLVLKGKYNTSSKGVWLRNSLIVFQFFISISMISGMLMLDKQMKFMQNKNLGFNKENVIVIDQAQELGERQQAFRNELLNMEGVTRASLSFAMPGDFIGNFIANSENPEIPQVRTFSVAIDDEYISTLEMEVVAGRAFSNDFNDSLNVVVNETTAFLLGYDDPIGKKVFNPSPGPNQSPEFTIVGVVRDYHHQSLHTEIPPMILFNISTRFVLPRIAIRVDTKNTLALLKNIEEKWKSFDIERPISYSFLDQKLASLYESDQQTGKIFTLFTAVTIIMACVGLFGLAAYVTQQRTKEIGVRKVLGASIGNIVLLLSINFTKLILISFLISLPLVYFGMGEWLKGFAYHTNIDPVTMIGAGILTVVLAWATISYYSIKIAILNPVNSLRSE
ncbi:MAG: ABC transporter permease [Cyclobacteriaceae bacterium]